MNINKITSFFLIYPLALNLVAQSNQRVDTLVTHPTSSHMFLNIEVPAGEVFMKSSGVCGKSVSRFFSPDPSVKSEMDESTDNQGNLVRKVRLKAPAPAESAPSPTSAARMAFTEQMTSLDWSGNGTSSQSAFDPDPTLSTDLFVDLGVGSSRLDFSGLSLSNVSINSAFADVYVTYSSPNLVEMKEMDIHAAKANIVVKNLELAKAELITIQNDMGETKIILGKGQFSPTTVYIQSGVGSCTLVIDESQPTKLVLKTGFFSTVDVPESFSKTGKGIYTNAAYKSHPDKATKIICNIDFGNISVMGQ